MHFSEEITPATLKEETARAAEHSPEEVEGEDKGCKEVEVEAEQAKLSHVLRVGPAVTASSDASEMGRTVLPTDRGDSCGNDVDSNTGSSSSSRCCNSGTGVAGAESGAPFTTAAANDVDVASDRGAHVCGEGDDRRVGYQGSEEKLSDGESQTSPCPSAAVLEGSDRSKPPPASERDSPAQDKPSTEGTQQGGAVPVGVIATEAEGKVHLAGTETSAVAVVNTGGHSVEMEAAGRIQNSAGGGTGGRRTRRNASKFPDDVIAKVRACYVRR